MKIGGDNNDEAVPLNAQASMTAAKASTIVSAANPDDANNKKGIHSSSVLRTSYHHAMSASCDESNKSKATTAMKTTTGETQTSSKNSSSNISYIANDENDVLPTNVCTYEQLQSLPPECLSSIDPNRPIQHVHEDGITITTYSLNPMKYCVLFILIVEMMERFSFYSINYTQTSYLTGQYSHTYNSDSNNSDDSVSSSLWNADMDSITASSYVSISIAVAYTAPFIGAMLGDRIFGEYKTILYGAIVFYWPGLLLIAITTIPHFLHQKYFNYAALQIGLLLLWPIGSGIVKSVVNIFGAKQYHPLLQSSFIEVYYVNFYMAINIGALIGGVVVPTIAQHNIIIAYFLPVIVLLIGICLFLYASPRYVKTNPKRNPKYMIYNNSTNNSTNNGTTNDNNTASTTTTIKMQPTTAIGTNSITGRQLFLVFLLIVPFCIAYSQMPTTFILQGTVMTKAFGGRIDAALMYNNDTISVLLFGYIIGSIIYPTLTKYNIRIPTTYKFAIGSAFGSFAILWALYVDYMIRGEYKRSGQTISILWQSLSYILIGIGEIFAISSAYEVAFTASPPEKKVLSSALNIFCIGGIPNIICIGLYNICSPWFRNSHGTTNISHISDYTSAQIDKYFVVLLCISTFGIIVNVLPSVRKYVESIEEISLNNSLSLLKTPKTPKTPMLLRRLRSGIIDNDDEENQALILLQQQEQRKQQQRHEFYLKYGSDRTLYHAGSMRAGPAMKSTMAASENQQSKQQYLNTGKMKKTTISKLYYTTSTVSDDDANKQQSNNKSSIPSQHTGTSNTASNYLKGKYISMNGRPASEWKPVSTNRNSKDSSNNKNKELHSQQTT